MSFVEETLDLVYWFNQAFGESVLCIQNKNRKKRVLLYIVLE